MSSASPRGIITPAPFPVSSFRFRLFHPQRINAEAQASSHMRTNSITCVLSRHMPASCFSRTSSKTSHPSVSTSPSSFPFRLHCVSFSSRPFSMTHSRSPQPDRQTPPLHASLPMRMFPSFFSLITYEFFFCQVRLLTNYR